MSYHAYADTSNISYSSGLFGLNANSIVHNNIVYSFDHPYDN